jgi:hypothetical protein
MTEQAFIRSRMVLLTECISRNTNPIFGELVNPTKEEITQIGKKSYLLLVLFVYVSYLGVS